MRKHTKSLIFFSLIILMSISCVHAAENTFQIGLSIVPDDYFPPSIPTNLVATPVSSSQVDLAWDASTDDVGVVGYRIFRDGAIVASTTGLSYSDTGLIASTTYGYEVEAFDSVPRYSGISTTVSTTTLQEVIIIIPPATTTPSVNSSHSYGYIGLVISDLVSVPSQKSATISFVTNQPAQVKVYWGMTSEYELGSISGLFYDFAHNISIDGLIPGTHYYFKVEATNALGIIKTAEGSFYSHGLSQEETLTNVDHFRAVAGKDSIVLSWNNPIQNMFDSVRVVRSEKFFPSEIYDGETVYEGRSQSYKDVRVEIGKTYYYSIFAKDRDGNYTSGTLAQAHVSSVGEVVISPISADPFIGIPVLDHVDPMIARLTLMDFDFIQNGKKLVNIGNPIGIDGSKNLTIRLNYDKVPEVLKTIAITLTDPEDTTQVFPFMLRVNRDKTAYEATVAPLGKRGMYKTSIVVLDHKNQGLRRMEGNLRAFVFGSMDGLVGNSGGFSYGSAFLSFGIIVLIIIVLIVVGSNHRIGSMNDIA